MAVPTPIKTRSLDTKNDAVEGGTAMGKEPS